MTIRQGSSAAALALALAVARLAGRSTQPADPAANWMLDYVTSRVAAKNLRSIGADTPSRVERRADAARA